MGGFLAYGGCILRKSHWVDIYHKGMRPNEAGNAGRLCFRGNHRIGVRSPCHIGRAPSFVCRLLIRKCGYLSHGPREHELPVRHCGAIDRVISMYRSLTGACRYREDKPLSSHRTCYGLPQEISPSIQSWPVLA